ncbi:hypothetical protein C8Q80DRAFT_572130 [Daedaleopsis nitida]|nr:hypothetical protein C8Q80DRAFT_572130 [Daedaleopsis nitida]
MRTGGHAGRRRAAHAELGLCAPSRAIVAYSGYKARASSLVATIACPCPALVWARERRRGRRGLDGVQPRREQTLIGRRGRSAGCAEERREFVRAEDDYQAGLIDVHGITEGDVQTCAGRSSRALAGVASCRREEESKPCGCRSLPAWPDGCSADERPRLTQESVTGTPETSGIFAQICAADLACAAAILEQLCGVGPLLHVHSRKKPPQVRASRVTLTSPSSVRPPPPGHAPSCSHLAIQPRHMRTAPAYRTARRSTQTCRNVS